MSRTRKYHNYYIRLANERKSVFTHLFLLLLFWSLSSSPTDLLRFISLSHDSIDDQIIKSHLRVEKKTITFIYRPTTTAVKRFRSSEESPCQRINLMDIGSTYATSQHQPHQVEQMDRQIVRRRKIWFLSSNNNDVSIKRSILQLVVNVRSPNL